MSIGQRASWLSSPSLASHWPAPVRALRLWGKVWVILAVISFVLPPLVMVCVLVVYDWNVADSGLSFGPWHYAFGVDHWRFWLAMALVLGGLLVSVAYFLHPRGMLALMAFAVIALLIDRLLSPTPLQVAQLQHPQSHNLFVASNPPRSVASIAAEIAVFASVFVAWLHLALVREPRPKPWECPRCAYDARGLPPEAERCPECGGSLFPPVKVNPRRLLRR